MADGGAAPPPQAAEDDLPSSPDTSTSSLGDDLHAELRRAVRQLRSLGADNASLKANFESLKALHVALQAQHGELGTRHQALAEERDRVENYYQVRCRRRGQGCVVGPASRWETHFDACAA